MEDASLAKSVQSVVQRNVELQAQHDKLKRALEESTQRIVGSQLAESATVQAFANKSMATVAAWTLSKTFHELGMKILENSMTATEAKLVGCVIYVVLMTFLVPLCVWLLRSHKPADTVTIAGGQKTLLQLFVPVFLAWGWKDLVDAITGMYEKPYLPALCVALVLTLIGGAVQATPCFARFESAIKAGGSSDTVLARIAVTPTSMALATGAAWNTFLTWAPTKLEDETNTPLFLFMIQFVYFVIVAIVVTAIMVAWTGRQESQAAKEANSEEKHLRGLDGQILVSSLGFVYAWALLNTLNDFYFNYMFECSSATACTYQSNFIFSLALTILFVRIAVMWKVGASGGDAWSRQATDVANKALILVVGFAWSNFCQTAVSNAISTSNVPAYAMYILLCIFVWFIISVFHRALEAQRRTLARQVQVLESEAELGMHTSL